MSLLDRKYLLLVVEETCGKMKPEVAFQHVTLLENLSVCISHAK